MVNSDRSNLDKSLFIKSKSSNRFFANIWSLQYFSQIASLKEVKHIGNFNVNQLQDHILDNLLGYHLTFHLTQELHYIKHPKLLISKICITVIPTPYT